MMFEVEVDVEGNRILFLTEPLVDVDDNEDHDVRNGSPSSTSTSRIDNHSSDDGRTSTGGNIIKYVHTFGDYLLLGLASVSTLAIGIFFALHPIHGHAFHPFGRSNSTNGSGGGGGGGGPNNHSVMMMTTMTMDVGSTTNAATTTRPIITTPTTKIDDVITKRSF
jgi:hypothetical protein